MILSACRWSLLEKEKRNTVGLRAFLVFITAVTTASASILLLVLLLLVVVVVLLLLECLPFGDLLDDLGSLDVVELRVDNGLDAALCHPTETYYKTNKSLSSSNKSEN